MFVAVIIVLTMRFFPGGVWGLIKEYSARSLLGDAAADRRTRLVGISFESASQCQKTKANLKRAFVTGAARGLGEGIVRRLAQDGWSILMSDITHPFMRPQRKSSTIPESRPKRLCAEEHDVASAERTAELVQLAVERFGGLDLAVANAGTGGVEVDLIDLPVEAFEHIVDVNYRGVFLTCKYAGRVMREQGSGNIITVSSIFGQESYPRVATYSGTKAGVIASDPGLRAGDGAP